MFQINDNYHNAIERRLLEVEPRDVFPNEIWDMIFQHLLKDNDLATITNCSNATPEWGSLLEPLNVNFLFNQIFPLVRKYLSFKTSLGCRCVCQAWKKSVDDYCQQFDFYSRVDFEIGEIDVGFSCYDLYNSSYIRKCFRFLLMYYFSSVEEVNRFMQVMCAHRSVDNPFITRCISIGTSYDARQENDLHNFLTQALLPKFGSQIWYLNLSLELSSPLSIYSLLRDYLRQLPNLKVLQVNCRNDEGILHLLEAELNVLQQVMELVPLPKLDNLAVLRVRQMPVPLLTKFLTANNRISKLRVSYDLFGRFMYPTKALESEVFHQMISRAYEEDLGEVKELGICYKYPPSPIPGLPHPNSSLGLTCSSLQSLTFMYKIKLTDLIQQTDIYRETLRNLTVHLEAQADSNQLINEVDRLQFRIGRLDLPCLETLEICTYACNFTSLDFLLRLKSLKKLFLRVKQWTEGDPTLAPGNLDQVIKFHGYLHRMYDSNIWQHLPRLDFVKLEIVIEPTPAQEYDYNYMRRPPQYMKWNYSRLNLPQMSY